MSFFDEILEPTATADRQNKSENAQIITGIVKENWNEEKPGTVRVEFVVGEKGAKESYWIGVMTPYCGNGFGGYALPEIGSEVVVGYIMGDKDRPVVLGCLWNDQIKIPENTANQENSIKKWKTKGGHAITASEESGKEKIEVETSGGMKVVMNDEEKSIVLSDKEKENTLRLDGKNGELQIKVKNKLEIVVGSSKLLMESAGNKILVDGGQIQIKGQQSIELKGQSMKAEGSIVEINSKGTLKVESSGIASVKGAMLKLN